MAPANVPGYRIVVDGVDITPRLAEATPTGHPRLIGLTLSERRDSDADQLDLTIDDSDGQMAIPRIGAELTLALGWLRGGEVMVGLVDKGRFLVDEVAHEGPPDMITVRARSADLASGLAARREQSWHGTTIGAVVTEIAGRQNLVPRCAPALSGIAIDLVAQSRESDMALLRRLGREHDAVATIKAGALLFSPIGAGTTASGTAIPAATIRRRDGDRHSYTVSKRDEVTGIEASWHDVGAARKKHVKVGKDGNRRHLSRVYATEAAATAAAKAEQSRLARLPVRLTFTLALGRPDLYPERRVTASGFKPAIDATTWLLSSTTHTLSASGLTSSLEAEAAT